MKALIVFVIALIALLTVTGAWAWWRIILGMVKAARAHYGEKTNG
jgi:hypothetical protein